MTTATSTERIASLTIKIHQLKKAQREARSAWGQANADASPGIEEHGRIFSFQCEHLDVWHHPAHIHRDPATDEYSSTFENCYLVWHSFKDTLPSDWEKYNYPFTPCPHCQKRIDARRALLKVNRELGGLRSSLTRLLNLEVGR